MYPRRRVGKGAKALVGAKRPGKNLYTDSILALNAYTGKLKLKELVTRTYSLDEVNAGYDDMRNGRNLRGVITF